MRDIVESEASIPSRDREGAYPQRVSKLAGNEESHGHTLLINYVLKCTVDILILP